MQNNSNSNGNSNQNNTVVTTTTTATPTPYATLYIITSTLVDQRMVYENVRSKPIHFTDSGNHTTRVLPFNTTTLSVVDNTKPFVLFVCGNVEKDLCSKIELLYAKAMGWEICNFGKMPSFIYQKNHRREGSSYSVINFGNLNGLKYFLKRDGMMIISPVHIQALSHVIRLCNGTLIERKQDRMVADWMLCVNSPLGVFYSGDQLVLVPPPSQQGNSPKKKKKKNSNFGTLHHFLNDPSNYVDVYKFIESLVQQTTVFPEKEEIVKIDEMTEKKKKKTKTETKKAEEEDKIMEDLKKFVEIDKKKLIEREKKRSWFPEFDALNIPFITQQCRGMFQFEGSDFIDTLENQLNGNAFRGNPCCFPLIRTNTAFEELVKGVMDPYVVDRVCKFLIKKNLEEEEEDGSKRKRKTPKKKEEEEDEFEFFDDDPELQHFQFVCDAFMATSVNDRTIWKFTETDPKERVFLSPKKLLVLFFYILHYENTIFVQGNVSSDERVKFGETICSVIACALRSDMTGHAVHILTYCKQILIMLTRIMDPKVALEIIWSKLGLLYNVHILGNLFGVELGYPTIDEKSDNPNIPFFAKHMWSLDFLAMFWKKAASAIFPQLVTSEDTLHQLRGITSDFAQIMQTCYNDKRDKKVSASMKITGTWVTCVVLSALLAFEMNANQGKVDYSTDFWAKLSNVTKGTKFSFMSSPYLVVTIMIDTSQIPVVKKMFEEESDEDDFFSKKKKKTKIE